MGEVYLPVYTIGATSSLLLDQFCRGGPSAAAVLLAALAVNPWQGALEADLAAHLAALAAAASITLRILRAPDCETGGPVPSVPDAAGERAPA